jgi:NitT/TauT family transport system ATP-binding protein
VLTARPGRIKEIVAIDRPRPRDPFAPEALAPRRKLTELLRVEVDRAFAEQEGVATAA